MNRNPSRRRLPLAGLLITGLATLAVQAQSPSAPAAPPSAGAADVEPAVDTSASRAGAAAKAPVTVAAPARAPVPAAPVGATAAAAVPAATAEAKAVARSQAGGESKSPAPAAQGAAARRSGRAMDRVDLDSSQITGNRELPRVLYIVPWRAPEAGELEGRPVNSLLNELTRPVDRDVFRRENRYFDALDAQARSAAQSPNADSPEAAAANPGGPEK